MQNERTNGTIETLVLNGRALGTWGEGQCRVGGSQELWERFTVDGVGTVSKVHAKWVKFTVEWMGIVGSRGSLQSGWRLNEVHCRADGN